MGEDVSSLLWTTNKRYGNVNITSHDPVTLTTVTCPCVI